MCPPHGWDGIASTEPDGYVTAWQGDLNPDLPTRILSIAELQRPPIGGFAEPSREVRVAVLDGLRRL
ncbi:hypothetical protein GCM10010470_47250 [Saccharopolyspora taberi]|uniref:Uncharacterized protein n=1 Tax=Saccharopolyspora taberi TaxID=60895 RepID=A0ABN3VHS3_9PSEU